MNPWTIDAREAINALKKVDEIDYDFINQNNFIKNFFDEDKYRFIVATKGFGKSLLLLAKRKTLSNIYLIPEHEPLDVPYVSLHGLSKEALSRLYNNDQFTLIWSLSIIIAIVKRLNVITDINKENISVSLKNILKDQRVISISSIFNLIIAEMNRRQFFEDLVYDYNRSLLPIIRNIKTPVAAFIDNVDECFESHADEDKEDDEKIWYKAQNCLVKAIYDLTRINSKIKLFGSIRKEAFLKYNTEMFLQYKGVSLVLKYTKDELKEIFVKNIIKDNPDNLMGKELIKKSPIVAFIGTDKIPHGHVQEDEDTFDYIFRHTLQRPRDLMEIGGKIISSKPQGRNPNTKEGMETLKSLINTAATTIATQYIEEVLRHLKIKRKDLNEIYKLIDSNVLTKERLKAICMKFNGNSAECMETDCKKCIGKVHIFCELYKIGLLGYVSMKPTEKDQYVQNFPPVGEKTFHAVGLLPDSTHYLIHPILDELIRQENEQYKHQINNINIVGYDRIWKIPKGITPESINRPTVFISSTNDLKSFRDAIEEVVINQSYAPIRSETINSPDALKKCKELAKFCHYFVAILGSRYGDEWDGKSICEHEFDTAFETNPGKIIVYVLEGDITIWDIKQQQFVKKVQGIDNLGYARGSRINRLNIKERFKKDILERTAVLTSPKTSEV